MKIEVSNGELLDKYTILQIKCERITNKQKLAHAERERQELMPSVQWLIAKYPHINSIVDELKKINEVLWDIEEKLRAHERRREFNRIFIELARLVYITNDQRSIYKSRLNVQTESELHEVKNHVETDDTEMYFDKTYYGLYDDTIDGDI